MTPNLLVLAKKASHEIAILKKRLADAGLLKNVLCAWCMPLPHSQAAKVETYEKMKLLSY